MVYMSQSVLEHIKNTGHPFHQILMEFYSSEFKSFDNTCILFSIVEFEPNETWNLVTISGVFGMQKINEWTKFCNKIVKQNTEDSNKNEVPVLACLKGSWTKWCFSTEVYVKSLHENDNKTPKESLINEIVRREVDVYQRVVKELTKVNRSSLESLMGVANEILKSHFKDDLFLRDYDIEEVYLKMINRRYCKMFQQKVRISSIKKLQNEFDQEWHRADEGFDINTYEYIVKSFLISKFANNTTSKADTPRVSIELLVEKMLGDRIHIWRSDRCEKGAKLKEILNDIKDSIEEFDASKSYDKKCCIFFGLLQDLNSKVCDSFKNGGIY
eukprot:NODE_8_length_47770_cov_0.334354.p11 type:complete len:328 gc:universal NODE_8_length_47770_cov_0.334354:28624-29607(+)